MFNSLGPAINYDGVGGEGTADAMIGMIALDAPTFAALFVTAGAAAGGLWLAAHLWSARQLAWARRCMPAARCQLAAHISLPGSTLPHFPLACAVHHARAPCLPPGPQIKTLYFLPL